MKAELAKWQTTNKFEAEWADILEISAALDYDGNVENSEYASNGQCIAQFGVKGNTLTFNITSTKATTTKMYVAVVSNFVQATPPYYLVAQFDVVWNLYVNASNIRRNTAKLNEMLKKKQQYLSSGF